MDSKPAPKPWFKDWTQYVFPGPARVFTAAELDLAGRDPLPRAIELYGGLNLFLGAALFIVQLPASWRLMALAWVSLLCGVLLLGARDLWLRPTRWRLNGWTAVIGLAAGLAGAWISREHGNDKALRLLAVVLLVVLVLGVSALWFLSLYRVQQIESRLRELEDRDAQLRLQRRLATAQIHPHFVFNTLASLTHWVETQDPRAAPMLRDFNAYLRATLPMFERERQSLREELDLVRRYLAIMAARLGDRLQWSMDADPQLENLEMPPGSLLTLVENAITHGIEPALRGGTVQVSVQRAGQGARLVVSDTGRGLNGPPNEGLGLSNTRQRLMTLHPSATMTLEPNAEGGCSATLNLPLQATAVGAGAP